MLVLLSMCVTQVRSKQHAASEGIHIAKWVILPDSTGYTNYWKVTVSFLESTHARAWFLLDEEHTCSHAQCSAEESG